MLSTVGARSYWLSVLAVAYACFASLQSSKGQSLGVLLLFALPLALLLVWRATASKPEHFQGRAAPAEASPHQNDDEIAASAARSVAVGASIFIAAQSGPNTSWLNTLSNVGVALASMAALVALARLPAPGGLLSPPSDARRLDAAAFASLFWTIAIALPLAKAALPERTAEFQLIYIDYATTAAGLSSMGLLLVSLFRLRASRRLELGTGDRIAAALWLTLTVLLIFVFASLAQAASPERLVLLTCALSSIAVAFAVKSREAKALSRILAITLSLLIPAAPIALFAVYIAFSAPGQAALVALLCCGACALLGLAAPLLARRFAPERTRWELALDAAMNAALNPDPEVALESALAKLQSLSGPRALLAAPKNASDGSSSGAPMHAPAGPVLYSLSPPQLMAVDRAGYLHTERCEIPMRLIELADGEPERIFRVDVADAVAVRLPYVRPLSSWLRERRFGAAALIRDPSTGPIGLLALPERKGFSARLTLDEARRIRLLADRLGAVLGVSSMLARSRAREQAAQQEAQALHAELQVKNASQKESADRFQALARLLERPIRSAAYAPASREAISRLENLAQGERPITLITPPGVDPLPWAALAHLASPRREGFFVVMDGADPELHKMDSFRDPLYSPLKIAVGGTLAILDAHILPNDIQSYIGLSLTQDFNFMVSLPHSVDVLVASKRLNEHLADRLGEGALSLPTLESRAEDMRALCAEHLIRIGTRLHAKPYGLDIRALALLQEHDWPGNDTELESVLLRAALQCEGDVIGLYDLQAIGFRAGTSYPKEPAFVDEPRPQSPKGGGKRRTKA